MRHSGQVWVALVLAAGAGACAGTKAEQAQTPPPAAAPQAASAASTSAPADGDQVEVVLCDGKTTTKVPRGSSGTALAGALMSEWLKNHPDSDWEAKVRESHGLAPAHDNQALVGQNQGQTYGLVSEADVVLWRREAERMALAGSRVFHSADELGSTVAVSCDMCHPHASNTHPETYPKFQPQLGRVALLRDMINWCVEHPLRARPFGADDPRMRALEAYIYAQRSGKPLQYGKL